MVPLQGRLIFSTKKRIINHNFVMTSDPCEISLNPNYIFLVTSELDNVVAHVEALLAHTSIRFYKQFFLSPMTSLLANIKEGKEKGNIYSPPCGLRGRLEWSVSS